MTKTNNRPDGLLEIIPYFMYFNSILILKKPKFYMHVVQESNNNKRLVKHPGVLVLPLPLSSPEETTSNSSSLRVFKSAKTPLVRQLTGLSPDYLQFGAQLSHVGRLDLHRVFAMVLHPLQSLQSPGPETLSFSLPEHHLQGRKW